MGESLGIKKYLYAGGLINDSRPFCVARDGKVFTREEVRSWGRLGDWRGKIVGTNESTISSISLLLPSSGVVPVRVVDLRTGATLDTFNITSVANAVTRVVVNKTYQSR